MIAHWPKAVERGGYAIEPRFDLEQTYDRHAKLLFSIAYSVLSDRNDAEDCVHDTLLRIWKNPKSYDPQRGELKSFLAVSVRNAAITMQRNTLRRTEIQKRLPLQEGTEELEIPDYLEQTNLREALGALPAEQWNVLRLAYFEHLTHVEIADRLALPLGTVKSRIALAIRRLHAALPPREVAG